MKCPNCNNELLDEALYCAQCGTKIERCKQCGQVLQVGAHYCSYCGTPVNNIKPAYEPINGSHYNRLGGYYKPLSNDYEQDNVVSEETVDFNEIKADKKTNKLVIVLSVIALIVSTALAGLYLSKTSGINPFIPSDNGIINTKPLKVSGDNASYTTVGNINQGGHATLYKDRLYVCDDEGRLVSMSTSFDDRKTLTDQKVEYVSIVDDIIYYVNQDMKICSIDINGNNQAIVVNKKAYYMNIVDYKIYYQSDEEGERLHVFDLKTLEDKELNQRVTYNINVSDDKIYYTSTDGIYCISVNGKGEEKLSGDNGYSMILRDNKLYYSTSSYETKVLDLNTKTSEKLVDERSSFLNMTSDYIFYYSANGVKKYDIKTKQSEVIYKGNIEFLEVVGNILVITDHDGHRIVMDFDGNSQQRLFLTNEQNFV